MIFCWPPWFPAAEANFGTSAVGGFALSRAASSTFVGPMPMSVMAKPLVG